MWVPRRRWFEVKNPDPTDRKVTLAAGNQRYSENHANQPGNP